jgi:Zn-dependent metalloprotease
MRPSCRCLNCIMPPHLLQKLLDSADKDIRRSALNTLLASSRVRGERSVRSLFGGAVAPGDGRRSVFDCRETTSTDTAQLVRSEGGDPTPDEAVNRAYDGVGTTRDFYRDVFDRNSIDGKGMRLLAYVHYDVALNNALWDGQEMLFGDGDGAVFSNLTGSLDVIGHELTHGVTADAAGLEYHDQPGALNESVSDVFGSVVKQWSLGQTADQADWLIGADVFTPAFAGDALRSLKAPGTAYDNADMGKDPQPDHISRYVQLPDTERGDHGGVHINSGIPNKAFYMTAMGIGGHAWEAPGHIWYESLKASNKLTQFQEFADTTYAKAGQLYGSVEQRAVLSAWREVGIRITGAPGSAARGGGRTPPERSAAAGEDSLAVLIEKIDDLSKLVRKALAK